MAEKAFGVDGLPALVAELSKVQLETSSLQREVVLANEEKRIAIQAMEEHIASLPSQDVFDQTKRENEDLHRNLKIALERNTWQDQEMNMLRQKDTEQ